jgi:integrase
VPFTATHYLTDYSVVGKSPKTAENVAYALAYLYSFAKHKNLDLNALVASGKTLNLDLIGPLIAFIRARGMVGPTFARQKMSPVSMNQTNQIAGLIKGYLRWALETYATDPYAEIERLNSRFQNLRYSSLRIEDARVLNADTVQLLKEAFDVGSTRVWRSDLDRLRNFCIFQIAYETGARISEILALQIGDISVGSISLIHIVKRRNEADTRKRKPRAKTFGRSLPISKRLHQRLAEYIQQRPQKHRSIFLFLSHEGPTKAKPLTLRRAHALFEDVEHSYLRDGRLVSKPTWHDIRYTALYAFYQKVKHLPNCKELLKQAAGHVSDSVFRRYHKMAIMEDVQVHLRELNDRVDENSTMRGSNDSTEAILSTTDA